VEFRNTLLPFLYGNNEINNTILPILYNLTAYLTIIRSRRVPR
jgi:hypothetical protein